MKPKWIERLQESVEGRRVFEQERLIVEVTEAIAALLKEQNVSRSELARRIGTSPAFVTKLLRGDNNFTLRTLSDVFFALNRGARISLGDLGENAAVCPTRASQPLRLSEGSWSQTRASWPAREQDVRLISRDGEDIAA